MRKADSNATRSPNVPSSSATPPTNGMAQPNTNYGKGGGNQLRGSIRRGSRGSRTNGAGHDISLTPSDANSGRGGQSKGAKDIREQVERLGNTSKLCSQLGAVLDNTYSFVSLNKIGDLKYYDEDLQAASSYYFQALDIRRNAIKQYSQPSQTIDVAVSLAKVADVDRNIGNEKTAVDGFQEAIEMLQCLKLNP
nr:protein NCA1 [Ipomoea batatas]